MSDGWNYPFRPPDASAPTTDPLDFDIDVFIPCEYCGELMELDEESAYILVGKVGRGLKSGRAMVVVCDKRGAEANLHVDCIPPWLGLDVEEEAERFCAGCEAKLSGDG